MKSYRQTLHPRNARVGSSGAGNPFNLMLFKDKTRAHYNHTNVVSSSWGTCGEGPRLQSGNPTHATNKQDAKKRLPGGRFSTKERTILQSKSWPKVG